MPIKNALEEQQVAIGDLVESIIEKNTELFSIVNKFTSLIASEFAIPVKGMRNWPDMNFKVFMSAIERQIKPNKLVLQQKSEWMQHFEAEKIKAITLKAEIDRLNAEIDQRVYALYGLTSDEISVIEHNLDCR